MYLETFFVYRHVRLDTNEPFYVGIGKVNQKYNSFGKQYQRAFTKTSRSKFWKNITSKTDWEAEIIFESNDRTVVCDKKVEFIKLYGRRDSCKGTLVNMSDGGDMPEGKKMSQETKDKISLYWKKHKHPMRGMKYEDHPAYGKGGFYGKHTPEAIVKIAARSKGWNHPGCKLIKEQVEEIHKAWNDRPLGITKKNFCREFEIKFDVKFRVIYNALKYNI